MAISVILVSSYSSKESVGTSTRRVILFGIIPTTIPDTTPSVISPTTHIDTTLIPTILPTIPPSPDYTPASLDYSPTLDTEFDPSEDPSSDHIPPLPATSPFLSLTDDSLDSDTLDTPPLPTHGRPFTETTLSTQSSHVASGVLRHHFSSDDSSSSSLSKTSLDSSADALSNSASSHSSSDHSSPTQFTLMILLLRALHRKRKIPTASVLFLHLTGALSYARANLLPSPKSRSRHNRDLNLDMVLMFRGVMVLILTLRSCRRLTSVSLMQMLLEIEGLIARMVIKSVQRDQGYGIVVTGQQSTTMLERIRELEQDNIRLRDMMDVANQRVARSQRWELRVQREMR
ncbi:hypothetical protein Tco_1006313 [Tanacetum coccineum]|uniref:Uncharacterized protein n=1 Tax=Tanacetum coccineum TaxID=301880 RepID=A0ABQ5FHE9_9ASTR